MPATSAPPLTRTSTIPARCAPGSLFDTEPKEEFDEYTSPQISVYLMARSY
ncbi:hypothetical protein COLSTE_00388 [Collinsella stercoris DSM 13279]|uniref:Uncharacterized protein n=1 Tax=Collinsella stercoris DSM 13279 TaxID=445975 RepID=B6G8J7_9ACTN|nr:hypothetical protein COLSTE_00388 [Collinsella stercoris DSM 13279]